MQTSAIITGGFGNESGRCFRAEQGIGQNAHIDNEGYEALYEKSLARS